MEFGTLIDEANRKFQRTDAVPSDLEWAATRVINSRNSLVGLESGLAEGLFDSDPEAKASVLRSIECYKKELSRSLHLLKRHNITNIPE